MVDVNKPVTNPELVEVMDKFLIEKNAENEFLLIEGIYHTNFLVPIIFDGEIEDGILKKDSTIGFKMINNNSNESFIPAFTDWDKLTKWSKNEQHTLITTYEDLKSLVQKTPDKIKGFVINPFNQNIINAI